MSLCTKTKKKNTHTPKTIQQNSGTFPSRQNSWKMHGVFDIFHMIWYVADNAKGQSGF